MAGLALARGPCWARGKLGVYFFGVGPPFGGGLRGQTKDNHCFLCLFRGVPSPKLAQLAECPRPQPSRRSAGTGKDDPADGRGLRGKPTYTWGPVDRIWKRLFDFQVQLRFGICQCHELAKGFTQVPCARPGLANFPGRAERSADRRRGRCAGPSEGQRVPSVPRADLFSTFPHGKTRGLSPLWGKT